MMAYHTLHFSLFFFLAMVRSNPEQILPQEYFFRCFMVVRRAASRTQPDPYECRELSLQYAMRARTVYANSFQRMGPWSNTRILKTMRSYACAAECDGT